MNPLGMAGQPTQISQAATEYAEEPGFQPRACRFSDPALPGGFSHSEKGRNL
jgi:hypothetical protein